MNISTANIPYKPKSLPSIVQVRNPELVVAQKSTHYWSGTFGITTVLFILWGCPFYLVIYQPTKSTHLELCTTTRCWLKRMFDCRTYPLACILTFLLLFPTIAVNIYVIYVFWDIFNHLFISGTYEMSMLHDLLGLIRYLPVVVPLNYVWLRGFRVNSIIVLLNSLHERYGNVGCATVRLRLLLMILAILGVHVIRYFCYERYDLTKGKPLQVVENLFEFSVDLFCACLLPLYCTFCYAVRFQLFTVKALVYRLVAHRVLPTVPHLDFIKILYTQAADHIILINDLFSLYLSVALIIMFLGTIIDAENLWRALLKVLGNGGATKNQFTVLLTILAREAIVETNSTYSTASGGKGTMDDTAIAFTAQDVREINADLACILITYGLMFFTIWQAVGTNDLAREMHVWLNDFVTGGGGTDVISVLQDLGISKSQSNGRGSDGEPVNLVDHTEECRLIWAKNTLLGCGGMQDEFLNKFRMLKAYMHARMQLEKPALLNITLVGILVPSLSGRLRGYRLMF